MKIPPDLAFEGKRFKEELSGAPASENYSAWWEHSGAGFWRFAFLFCHRALGRGMFVPSHPFPAPKRRALPEVRLTAACSCLMGLVLLAMLCLGRPDLPVVAGAEPGAASIGMERSGEVAALLRVTGKVQALEVRSVRPVLAKFASGHLALPAPQAVFLRHIKNTQAAAVAREGAACAPDANTNQPRAPPSRPA
ncbi:hypothetical protein EN829_029150 [Mesorhizobium sp. M00.F.Ca.ET.186.01.1.1]|nr:hypothetical protein EN848_13015 [bacterium M00.F.Ca.ET.205.01.1.1]TGU47487.1 hypothetical protein EN795_29610 [bacterium M00.F.Ca.ET.152.01.1.1]TGV32188.1 hypothetical protein EN829_029150 [Mesorhizobium sp. M00.F.Ca.ET.186.01.1.1]TGZ39263.1 hypothetical protein EN805_29720 [bacterium M00.F.Ca.ET.162.01.1.1]